MEKLERIVRARVDSRRTTGIFAGMVFPDGETRGFAYGSAGGGKRLTASSVFEIGSITKVFTATVLADMVQRGEVRLTDPVSSLLPPNVKVPSRNGRAITLEDLATHSSGLPREATNLRPKNALFICLFCEPTTRRGYETGT
jgi:CubicO group peptidase (beta-lactamase class C family)